MLKAYRFRLYPSKSQVTRLRDTFEMCRQVYNRALKHRMDAWDKREENLSYYDEKKTLPLLKKEHPELKEVHSQVLQDTHQRVNLALQAYWRRCKEVKAGTRSPKEVGKPRLKGLNQYKSITYPQGGWKLQGNTLTLSKIGDVKIKLHRKLQGEVKTVTISRTQTGKWFVSFSCEVEVKPRQRKFKSKRVVGIDLGVNPLVTFSDESDPILPPRFLIQAERRIKKLNNKFRTSGYSDKVRLELARVYEKIANQRLDFAQKLAQKLIYSYSTIIFEDLETKELVHENYLAKRILDATWGKLVNMTQFKAESAGTEVILVDPRNTTQMCSACGKIVYKELKDRVHSCPYCGLVLDRDKNAAINIYNRGIGLYTSDNNKLLIIDAHVF